MDDIGGILMDGGGSKTLEPGDVEWSSTLGQPEFFVPAT